MPINPIAPTVAHSSAIRTCPGTNTVGVIGLFGKKRVILVLFLRSLAANGALPYERQVPAAVIPSRNQLLVITFLITFTNAS